MALLLLLQNELISLLTFDNRPFARFMTRPAKKDHTLQEPASDAPETSAPAGMVLLGGSTRDHAAFPGPDSLKEQRREQVLARTTKLVIDDLDSRSSHQQFSEPKRLRQRQNSPDL